MHGPGALTALPWFIPSLLTLQPAAEPVLPTRYRSWPGLAAHSDGGTGLSAPARKGQHVPGRFGAKIAAFLVLRPILPKLCAAIRLWVPGLLPGPAWPCLPPGA